MSLVDDRIFFTSAPRGTDPARHVLTGAPACEPVSVEEFREFVRLDAKTEARTLGLILRAARGYFERVTGLALISQEWRVEFDRLPQMPGTGATRREIELLRAPFLAVTSVQYKAQTTGVLTTFSSGSYSTAGVGNPRAFGRVWLNEDAAWPDLGGFPAALQVTFTAGFGTKATDVPEDLRLAVMMLAAWWYENRLPVNVGNIVNSVPHHLEALIDLHRVALIA